MRLPDCEVPGVVLLQILLGAVHERDHAAVRFLRRRAEREDAVIHQDHSDRRRLRLHLEFSRTGFRQIEPRHDVGDDDDIVAVDFADARCAAGRVGDGQDCVRMCVVDKFVRQHCVQNRFDRRSWRTGASHLGDELVHHLRIRQRIHLREL